MITTFNANGTILAKYEMASMDAALDFMASVDLACGQMHDDEITKITIEND
tara:strand:+ start:1721 stop:1873 length:153 start_codon:yes stop_codon:yes gene_type:complete